MAIQKISGVTIELDNQATGDVAYFDGTDWVRLEKGEAGEVLTMNEEEDAPQWGTAPPTWLPLGTLRGYSCGGNNGSWYTSTRYNNIDSYSFVNDGNATDWGDLIRDNYYMASTSSATHGYSCGGEHTVNPYPGQVAVYDDHIQKFSMAANANLDIGANDFTKLSGNVISRMFVNTSWRIYRKYSENFANRVFANAS